MTTAKQQGPRMVVGIVVVVQCTHCMHAAIAQPIALPERELCVCVCARHSPAQFSTHASSFLMCGCTPAAAWAQGRRGGGEACNHGHIREQA